VFDVDGSEIAQLGPTGVEASFTTGDLVRSSIHSSFSGSRGLIFDGVGVDFFPRTAAALGRRCIARVGSLDVYEDEGFAWIDCSMPR